ncbi:MAG TPA: DUF503 domain-containing protein [Candidatus Dormibacteraeota bacterium]|jgi:uncharacterized protein|nr:DUF503 domain-containing protein [Candidatus Dormibacteraeota bacterium]
MVIGSLTVSIHIPESHSLKEKRQVVQSVVARLRRTFNIAVAEVGDQDTWQLATIGIACVSGDGRHADEMCQKVLRHLENEGEAQVTTSRFELIHA